MKSNIKQYLIILFIQRNKMSKLPNLNLFHIPKSEQKYIAMKMTKIKIKMNNNNKKIQNYIIMKVFFK